MRQFLSLCGLRCLPTTTRFLVLETVTVEHVPLMLPELWLGAAYGERVGGEDTLLPLELEKPSLTHELVVRVGGTMRSSAPKGAERPALGEHIAGSWWPASFSIRKVPEAE